MSSDMMEREVMIDELHMVVRKKVQTYKVKKRKKQKCKKEGRTIVVDKLTAMKEKNLGENIESLKESLQRQDLKLMIQDLTSY